MISIFRRCYSNLATHYQTGTQFNQLHKGKQFYMSFIPIESRQKYNINCNGLVCEPHLSLRFFDSSRAQFNCESLIQKVLIPNSAKVDTFETHFESNSVFFPTDVENLSYKKHRELCMELIKHRPFEIYKISDLTQRDMPSLVNVNHKLVIFHPFVSAKQQIKIVKNDPDLIAHMFNPCKSAQLIAVEHNPYLYFKIANPHFETKILACNKNENIREKIFTYSNIDELKILQKNIRRTK
jgi:hypothetical protein